MTPTAVDAAITDRLIVFYEALLARGQIAPATQEEPLSTALCVAAEDLGRYTQVALQTTPPQPAG